MKKEGEQEEKRRKKKINRVTCDDNYETRSKTIAMTSKMATVAVTMKTVTRMMVVTMT